MTNNDSENNNIRDIETARLRKLAAANHARPPSEPMVNLPPVVKKMSLLLVAVFLVQQYAPASITGGLYEFGSFVPARYTGGLAFDAGAVTSPVLHMLLHGSWLHLLMNLGMLMAFGAGLERYVGARVLLVLFILTGIAGAFFHVVFYPDALRGLIGASGGISGLFGAVLMMMFSSQDPHAGKHARLKQLMPFVAVWIGVSLFFGFFGMRGEEADIAWTAHIGGFLAGLVLYAPIVKRF